MKGRNREKCLFSCKLLKVIMFLHYLHSDEETYKVFIQECSLAALARWQRSKCLKTALENLKNSFSSTLPGVFLSILSPVFSIHFHSFSVMTWSWDLASSSSPVLISS